MQATLLVITLAASLSINIIKKYLLLRLGNSTRMYVKFNLVTSVVTALILLCFAGFAKVSLFTLLTGALFGLITAIGFYATMIAMDSGPLSYTSLMISLASIIPTLSGYLIWNEPISKITLIGVALMLVCFVCSVDYGKKEKKASLKWFVFGMLCFLTTGFCGVMQKWHQSSPHVGESDAFLVIAFLAGIIVSLIILPFTKKENNPNTVTPEVINGSEETTALKPLSPAVTLLLMALCGVAITFNNKINLYLAGIMESAVFFPIVNGGGLILTSVTAFIFFKERLSKIQWFGLVIGMIAVIFLCDPFSA